MPAIAYTLTVPGYLMNFWLKQDSVELHTTIHAHFLKIRADIVLEDLHYFLTQYIYALISDEK